MSRPRHYWFYSARRMIMRYPGIKDYKGLQELIWADAIDRALDYTKNLPNGEERYKAIKKVLFDKTVTVVGAAEDLSYSEINVRRWINEFINLCGKYAGY